MSKRKSRKKRLASKPRAHNRPAAGPPAADNQVAATASDHQTSPLSSPVEQAPAPIPASNTANYIYKDVARVGVLTAVFLAIELGLWLAFKYTGLGQAVYSLIRL